MKTGIETYTGVERRIIKTFKDGHWWCYEVKDTFGAHVFTDDGFHSRDEAFAFACRAARADIKAEKDSRKRNP